MATVIFDFDSTLISCESLEEIVKTKKIKAERLKQIQEITSKGMSGEIDFLTSLKLRLSLVSLSRQDFLSFGESAFHYLTPGIDEVIAALQEKGVDIWIVSGALREVLVPLGRRLKIPEDQLLGITLDWTTDGHVAGVNEDIPINRSKWEGAQAFQGKWSSPRIAIGDGVTDFALYEHELVEHFIAFTQNVRRQALVDQRVPEAHSVLELRGELEARLQS